MRNAEPSFPRIAPPAGHKSVLNPCRKAHRNYSLFPIHYSLSTRPVRRHTAPRHSPPHSPGTPENCSPQGRGNQFPGDPRWLSGWAGTFFPLTAPPAGHKSVLNPCRKAHRTPAFPTPLPGNARELLPAGALSPPGHGSCPGCVRVGLACPQILSANCSPQGQGASLFHGDMIK